MDKIKIGDVCEILNGYAFKSDNYVDAGIRVIRIANVQKGYIEDNTPAFYPVESDGLEKYMLEEGVLAWHNEAVFGKSRRFAPLVLNNKIVEDIALVGSNGDLNLVVELCL